MMIKFYLFFLLFLYFAASSRTSKVIKAAEGVGKIITDQVHSFGTEKLTGNSNRRPSSQSKIKVQVEPKSTPVLPKASKSEKDFVHKHGFMNKSRSWIQKIVNKL
ncbi:hypothetical protein K502DRAFT_349511 [Neoconidiobolus thromboides FSU 785]|nr:hypothetical protein K502DRAFT_349511 [Neoconidiobolus thromboides FSU 785]